MWERDQLLRALGLAEDPARFSSQHPHGASQAAVTPVLFSDTIMVYIIHEGKTFNTQKIKELLLGSGGAHL